MTDDELNRLISSCFENPGDRDAVGAFYRGFQPHLRAILSAVAPRDVEIIDDAVQAAFIRFMEIFQTGRRDQMDYLRYFVAVAKNCLRDEFRHRSRTSLASDEELEALTRLPKNEAQELDSRILVWQAMTELDARCRYLLQRWYIVGERPDKLASALKLGRASVYVVLQRCRDRLRGILAAD